MSVVLKMLLRLSMPCMPLFFFFIMMSFSDEAIVKIRFGGVIIDIFKTNSKSIQSKFVTRNLVFKNPVRVKFAN